jgi:PAS domain-containing protein
MSSPTPPAGGTDPEAVYVVIHNGIVTFVGSNTMAVSGFAPEHFRGRHDDHDRVARLFKEGWTGRFSEHVRIQERDGNWTWRLADGVRTIDPSGEPHTVAELRKVEGPVV